MTAKIVALYTRPDDSDAFDRQYFATHMPLVNRVPGLQRVETARFVGAADAGEQTYYRITELYFADPGGLRQRSGRTRGRQPQPTTRTSPRRGRGSSSQP